MKSDRSWFLGASLLKPGAGGIARVARLSALSLAHSGCKLEVVSLLDGATVDLGRVQARALKGSRVAFLTAAWAASLKHTYCIYDAIGPARAHLRLPCVASQYAVWIHGVEVLRQMHPTRARVLRNANLVLANSRFTLEQFERRHWKLPNAKVCWLATEDDRPPDAAPKSDGPPTVLIVARMEAAELYKGHSELISAWPTVVASKPDARLLIVGTGTGLAGLRALAQSSAASRSIIFTGFVDDGAMREIWRQAHIFAMPSRGEGFGLVYAEAMRQGLPVIASVHDAGAEINVDGVTGINVDLDEPQSVSHAILDLLNCPDKARRMGEAGFDRWRAHFTYSRFQRRFLNALPY